MTSPACWLCTPYSVDHPLALAHTRHFKAFLNQGDQRTPGRLIIATHAHIGALRDWTDDQWTEFGRFEAAIERALAALDPDEPQKLINAQCMMNLAGEEGTHTHWRIMPHYRRPIMLTDDETGEAVAFTDDFYGQPYNFDHAAYREVSPGLIASIVRTIRAAMDLGGIEGARVSRTPD